MAGFADDLAARFLGAVTSAEVRAALEPAAEPLGKRLAALIAEASRAWPAVELDPRELAAFLGSKNADPGTICVRDLYLACACARGDPRAIAAFEAGPLAAAVELVRRDASWSDLDDALQKVRLQLLTAAEARAPAIATYAGRSELRSWLGVIVAREVARGSAAARAHARADTGELAELPAAESDPEMRLLRRRYLREFRDAFAAAVESLSSEERALLRYAYVERLSVDDIAVLEGVSRATAARRVVAARQTVAERTRTLLAANEGLSSEEVDSVLRLIDSQVDLSLARLLA